jgi:hypothetical protein
MTDSDIIADLYQKIQNSSGRHLYGVLGSYAALQRFARRLEEARFPRPLSITRGILDTIPDDEFRDLVTNEAKQPQPIRAHVRMAFERFLRTHLTGKGLVVMEGLELLFAYDIDLAPFRTLATDDNHLLLLLPGMRERGYVKMYPNQDKVYALPPQLIADHHLWELHGS